MNKKKIWKKTGRYTALLLFLLIGAACGILIAHYLDSIMNENISSGPYLVYFGFLLLAFYLVMFLQIIIHEAGHLVFGLLSGYQFTSFRIGRLMWIRQQNGKLKFRKMSIAGTGGQCLMSPPDWPDDGSFPYILYNLGGSFLNLLTVPVCICACILCQHIPWLMLFFAMMGITGFGFALLNGIPMQPGAVDNDGCNTVSIGQSSAARRSFWIQMKSNEQIAKGIRLKDMPDEWFRLPEEDEMKNSMTAAIAVFHANRLMDAHAFSDAGKLIDHLLSLEQAAIVDLHRSLLICDRLYCELIQDCSHPVIEKLLTKKLNKFRKQMKNFPSVIRTSYALALLYENDAVKAAQFKKQFETCAASYPYPSDIESERELLKIAENTKRQL